MVKCDEMVQGEVIARLSNTHVVKSGRLLHGAKSWTTSLDGDEFWVDGDKTTYNPGHRAYTWDGVQAGDTIIFWSGRSRGEEFIIHSVYKEWVNCWLTLEKSIYNPRKGDKFSIFRNKE